MRQHYEIVNMTPDNGNELAFVIHNGCLMQFDNHNNLMCAVIDSDGRIDQEEIEPLTGQKPYRSGGTSWEFVEVLDEESIQTLEKAFPKEKKAFANFRKMNAPYSWQGYYPNN